MIEDNTYEENVKDFNSFLFNLDDKDFNWDMHAMIDNVVKKIEFEYTMNCMMDEFNAIYIDRFQDVLKWESFQKFIHPKGSIPPLSYSGAAPSGYSKPTPKRCSFTVGKDGRRRRKKYL